jgi:hypothetical protein
VKDKAGAVFKASGEVIHSPKGQMVSTLLLRVLLGIKDIEVGVTQALLTKDVPFKNSRNDRTLQYPFIHSSAPCPEILEYEQDSVCHAFHDLCTPAGGYT